MIKDWFRGQKKIIIFVLLPMSLYLVIGWGAYSVFGRRFINAMYEGRAIGILNKIIQGQDIYPVSYYLEITDKLFPIVLILSLFLIAITIAAFKFKLLLKWLSSSRLLENHTNAIDAIPVSRIGLWIALAACLGLYIELMIIRIHSSSFQLFAYFKNVSLLSCFLGLGIGYTMGPKRPLSTPFVFPFLALQIIFMYILRFSYIAKILQNPISEQLALNISQTNDLLSVIMVYSFLILIFAFNALCFIPLGHLVSRLMMRRQKLIAYNWNLIGSLIGIFLFSFLSFIWTPPSVWVVLAAIMLMVFLYKDKISLFILIAAAAILVTILAIPFNLNQFDIYSPYQILTLVLSKDNPPAVAASNTYYQRILDLREENIKNNLKLKQWADYYALPYCFKSRPERVLIVGSGTGNDVAAALRNGAGEIDAVEIDPAILQFGKQLHPESPYQASNVNAIVNDARSFIRHTEKQYDLIVYGLLDSHTLLTNRSGIRLDSYVYTVEGFREARNRLKKEGFISLTFAILSKELGRKLYLMLQEAFNGESPIVYQIGYEGGYTFLIGDGLKKYSLNIPPTVKNVTNIFADDRLRADKSTDDWPFFYMPVRKYPVSYIIMIITLLVVSAVFIRYFVIGSTNRGFSIPCFFLGAGFMLVETKGITELALVYGSTWFVISIVIAAILIMAFLANSLIIRIGNPPIPITYTLLFISLIIGLGLTFINFSFFPSWLSQIIMTAVLTLPLFFSGFAFSSELRRSVSVEVALSSNLLGAMLGGFIEYNSMYFGFRSLYIFALLMYGFAFLWSIRVK